MRSILIIFGGLLPLMSFGNTFSFEKRPYDFRLEIAKSRVVYRSHQYSLNEPINECERPFAEALNLEFLSFAEHDPNGSEAYLVDGKTFKISKGSRFALELASIDLKIRTFALEMRKACSR